MDTPSHPPDLPDSVDPTRAVGITTTVPVEVIMAAGLIPIDLNNVFIGCDAPEGLIENAEGAGFPKTCCCWTRGLYGAACMLGLKRVIGVTQGDCSNTHALMEMLQFEGVECFPFAFPHTQDAGRVAAALHELTQSLGADPAEAERWRCQLAPARAVACEIDRLTWQDGKVSGRENHLWLVSTSDFCADPDAYQRAGQKFIVCASKRKVLLQGVRLAFVGVPPIVPEIYDHLEAAGGRVVFNETQRQFSMPFPAMDLAAQYAHYTYPYGIFARLSDITQQCARRGVDGIIHYVQSFCFRRIEDRILRERTGLPVLTVEGDLPGPLSGQLKTRLEAFVQMLEVRKSGRAIF